MTELDILIGVISNAVYEKGKSLLKSKKHEYIFDKKTVEVSLKDHIHEVQRWCSKISHRGMKTKDIDKNYVHLRYYNTPKRDQFDGIAEKSNKLNLKSYLTSSNSNTIILGQPGAGKTTSSKFIAYNLLNDRGFCSDKYKIPVVLRLTELKAFKENIHERKSTEDWEGFDKHAIQKKKVLVHYETLFEKILWVFGFREIDHGYKNNNHFIEKIVIELLEANKILLILEGFDEYPFSERGSIVDEIKTLALRLKKSRFILTSRTADFPYSIENSTIFEIAPLDNLQIQTFAKNWLKDVTDARSFFKQLTSSTYLDTARRPLTLSHLLTIFEKSNPKTIPRKPNAIYSKVVELLIREWDEERNITRESTYASFQAERKKSFLCKLSFYLTKTYFGTTFSYQNLRMQYLQICKSFELPKDESHTVLKELESHSGLFIKSSSDKYQFAHKSIQEYFTAEYLKSLPNVFSSRIRLSKIPNELAILVALSLEPNDYFESIIDLIIEEKYSGEFISPFISRVMLENPDFTVSLDLALSIIGLFTFVHRSDLTQEDQEKSYKEITNLILQNRTILESIYKIEKHYELERDVAVNIIKAATSPGSMEFSFEDIVLIRSKVDPEKTYSCKLLYINKWTNIRPAFDVWKKKVKLDFGYQIQN